ncbi:MAG TPA: PHP domain-containing protein [Thermoanaerobaculia bacterium]|nr:PHP domain-containing protein [Thermoanaerobaculia bacterium]
MGFADLHLHTFHSDGIRSPAEVVRLAAEHGLETIAITDHDNLAAFPEAEGLARAQGITLIPGVELSITWSGIDVHLLAYAFDPGNERLRAKLEACRDTRERRGEIMVERLRDLGIPIDLARVRELCGEGALGRPHIARALVEAGTVSTIDEAFDRFLSPGGAGWVEKERLELDEAIDIVRRAGGLTSLAHPTLYPDGEQVLRALIPLGIDGVEILHPDVGPDAREAFRAIAAEHGLIATGGSDDHGFDGAATFGSVKVPLGLVQPILDRWLGRAR